MKKTLCKILAILITGSVMITGCSSKNQDSVRKIKNRRLKREGELLNKLFQ
ncbi:hypothetical protein [Clostridium sp. Marseille-Q7071]